MSGVVSNATPLIYLAKIGKIDLLRKVFKEVFIPEEVKVEAVDEGKSWGRKMLILLRRRLRMVGLRF